jgi:hypothetical protein
MMNTQDQIRSSARFARELLQMVAEGIGKLEHTAGNLPQMASKTISRGLPALKRQYRHFRHQDDSSVARTLLISGVVVGTAALIYSSMRNRPRGTRVR